MSEIEQSVTFSGLAGPRAGLDRISRRSDTRRISEQPQLLASYPQQFVAVLAELGVHPRAWRDVLPEPSDDAPEYVPVRVFEGILQNAANQLGDPCLGFRIGLDRDLKELGVLGYVLRNSPTVAIAAENFLRYFRIYQTGTDLRCVRDDRHFMLAYRVLDPALTESHQDGELVLGWLITAMAALAGDNFRPLEVHFRRATPYFAAEYQARLPGTRIRFGQPFDAVLAEPDVVDRPVANADDDLLPILEEHAKSLLPRETNTDELLAQIEDTVFRSFRAEGLHIDDVARAMGLGRRTLQRRLEERGLTFHQVADGVRERLARQHVAASELSLSEVAFLLGYSEQSAFSRAFRRWTGETPRTFREQGGANLS